VNDDGGVNPVQVVAIAAIFVAFCLTGAFVCRDIAERRGLDPRLFFYVGLAMPVLGVLLALTLPPGGPSSGGGMTA
jgi:hypothetical protein